MKSSISGLFKSLKFTLTNYSRETFKGKRYSNSRVTSMIESLTDSEELFYNLHPNLADYIVTFEPSCNLMLKTSCYSRAGWFLENYKVNLTFEAETISLSEIYRMSLTLALSETFHESKKEAYGVISLAILSHLYSIYLLICGPENTKLIAGILKNVKVDLKLDSMDNTDSSTNDGSSMIQSIATSLGINPDLIPPDVMSNVAKNMSDIMEGGLLTSVVSEMSEAMSSMKLTDNMSDNMEQVMKAMQGGAMNKVMERFGLKPEMGKRPEVKELEMKEMKVEELKPEVEELKPEAPEATKTEEI